MEWIIFDCSMRINRTVAIKEKLIGVVIKPENRHLHIYRDTYR